MNASMIRKVYHIILTVALVAAGLCLIAGCLQVYYSGGEQIYTLEKIGRIFGYIAVPVYIALILVIGSFILELFLPAPKKAKPEKNHAMILRKLQQRADLNRCGDRDLTSMVLSLRRQRRILAILSIVMLAVSTAAFLIYAFTAGQYPSLTTGKAVTEAMVQNTLVWAVCAAFPFGLGVYVAYATRSSMKTEIELLRHVALDKVPPKTAVQKGAKLLFTLRGSLIVLAIALIVVGAVGEGWRDVLTKAVAICTECVGLG